MTGPLKPQNAKDVEEAIQAAIAGGRTLEIVGHGSKRTIGRAAQWDVTLDLSGLSGVTLYEPAELVLSARAGTPLAEIEALVEANGQQLAFEPMDYGPILGTGGAGGGTIGGTLAANLSGPRRIKAGAARDHFLGFTAVSGRGETFKSGGRVVKNVTGYDLSKLLAGSWGTLAVMTDISIKVLPRPEAEETLLVFGLDGAMAARVMNLAMGSAGEVSGAAHLPEPAAKRLPQPAVRAGQAVTALRLEGVPPSIRHRRALLEGLLKSYGALGVLQPDDSRTFWRSVRDVLPFAAAATGREQPLWRISTAPLQGPEVATRITAEADANVLYDWAGGLIWAQLPLAGVTGVTGVAAVAGVAAVRRAVAASGGYATLIRAPAALRAALPVFEPQDQALSALIKRVKDSFDPNGVLNPGRMYAGV